MESVRACSKVSKLLRSTLFHFVSFVTLLRRLWSLTPASIPVCGKTGLFCVCSMSTLLEVAEPIDDVT